MDAYTVSKVIAITSVSALSLFGLWNLYIRLRRKYAVEAPLIAVSRDIEWHAALGISTKNFEICLTMVGMRIEDIDAEKLIDNEDDNDVEEIAERVLNRVDAVLMAAGGDLGAWAYDDNRTDEEYEQILSGVNDKRDRFDIALARGALRRNMPLMGICRGNQLINVANGGKLTCLRDNKEVFDRHGPGIRSLDAHVIELTDDESVVADCLRASKAPMIDDKHVRVSSFHGSAVSKPGQGFRAVAVCPNDGTIEATENPSYRFCLTTQFHPEFPPFVMQTFFELLAKRARAYKAERSFERRETSEEGVKGQSNKKKNRTD